VRIYAYAGTSSVKVDYQLQNSAKNKRVSWPLYFEDLSILLKPTLDSPTLRLAPDDDTVWSGTPGHYLFQDSLTSSKVVAMSNGSTVSTGSMARAHPSSYAWADLSDQNRGVTVAIRNMSEMWPNGIDLTSGSDLIVRLWPEWSSQWVRSGTNSTGLYWLDDMQHVVKETLFWFHGAGVSSDDIEALAANFQYHPVVPIPVDVYRSTSVTMDLTGIVPANVASNGADTKRPKLPSSNRMDPGKSLYSFGWGNFGGDTYRRKSNQTGNWPSSSSAYFADGHVGHFYDAERRMWGDLNTRPMWLAGYDHHKDFALVGPTVNPYGGRSWRAFEGNSKPFLALPYLPGTDWSGWTPRDNEHGWFYHIEEYYYMSGNLWVRDWYEFIKEFRKRTLFRPMGLFWPDGVSDPMFEFEVATRGEGHMLANSMQAYRVTGDPELMDGIRTRIDWLRGEHMDMQYGSVGPHEAAFQLGFFARPIIGILTELRGADPEYEAKAFLILWGTMDWNYNISQYSYYIQNVGGSPLASSGTALTMVDPTAIWYLWSGQRKHFDLMVDYIDNGLHGGSRPHGDAWPGWGGTWEDRAAAAVRQTPKANETPAAAITDLSASSAGGRVTVTWTAPAKAKRYLVVWSTKPIARTYDPSAGVVNFWAGNPVGNTLDAVPGTQQSLVFTAASAGTKVYVAVATLTADSNLSEISNVTSTTVNG